MKQKGSTFEYKEEQNKDFLRAYRELASRYCYTNMSDLFDALVKMPSKRFWVSEERAAIVIAAMLRGDSLSSMRPTKRAMFREIFRRCTELLRSDTAIPLCKVVSVVVRQPAPSFYMTAGSAKVLFYSIRNDWRKDVIKKG